MADLLVITPSRGRPGKAGELITAVRKTAHSADLILAVDDDDPCLSAYRKLAITAGVTLVTGEPKGLAAWTNLLAAEYAGGYRALASFGDDHRPRTPGWDKKLLAALDRPGIAYGDDLLQGENLPTACAISSSIVRALGWMCLPGVRHYFVDNAWKVLGKGAGCLHYVPEVVIEHEHPLATGEQPDATYLDAYTSYAADQVVFGEWRAGQAFGDAETVRRLVMARA